MGFRQAAVLASASFFLGIVFICATIDYRILYLDLTESNIQSAYTFYAAFHNCPPAVKTMMHSMMGVGLVGLLGKITRWDESAMFFDGSSLAAFVFGITIYLTVTIPGLRAVVMPPQTKEEEGQKVEALRVMCAGNILIGLCLIGVLCLQAGQEYARRMEKRELARLFKAEAAAAEASLPDKETKKDK